MYDNGSSQSDGHHGRSKSKQSSSGLPSDSSNGMGDDDCYSENRTSNFSASGGYDDPGRMSAEGSPMMMSPWNNVTPFQKSSWIVPGAGPVSGPQNALVGSLVREEGHIYSLATRRGDLLYTGSDSKNIRVWKNLKEFSGFKSASGLVKAIVISGEKIFTGHQDGKIRVWKVSSKNPSAHKRYGSLPTLKDLFKSSMKPSNYVEVKRNRSALWIKHSDAISCMSLDEEKNLLYSASWDRTVKVWKIGDSKCLESVAAHTDAVNSVVTGSGGLVFTGSADGTVKVWRREEKGSNIKSTKHVFMQTLLKQETAVTALAVDPARKTIYCGSSDGLVNFWEVERNLAHGGVMKGHKLAVLCLSAVGKLVFSGSADKNICVWRREEGAGHVCISVLSGHTGPVKCLAVEEDREAGERDKWKVYSGSLDKSVKVWSVSEQMMSSMNMMMDGDESVQSDRPSDFM